LKEKKPNTAITDSRKMLSDIFNGFEEQRGSKRSFLSNNNNAGNRSANMSNNNDKSKGSIKEIIDQ